MISANSSYSRNYESDMMEHDKYVPRIEVFWENHVVSRDVAEYRSSWKTYWTTHVANT